MKGLIFTEFLDLVEQKFGLEMVDRIIEASDLKSEGIYTSVGTYEFSELLQLLNHLSITTQTPTDDLLLVYAEHLFAVLVNAHPDLVRNYNHPMDLIASIENHIHVEVQKIYPDAQLPTFELVERTNDRMELIYKSDKGLYVLGKGLMIETFKLFKVPVDISYEKLNAEGTKVRFVILINDEQQ